jgi:hypothetical protein
MFLSFPWPLSQIYPISVLSTSFLFFPNQLISHLSKHLLLDLTPVLPIISTSI